MKTTLALAVAAVALLSAAPSWAQYSPLITAPMANGLTYGYQQAYGPGYSPGYAYPHYGYTPGHGFGYGAAGTNGVDGNGGTSGSGSGGSTAGSAMH